MAHLGANAAWHMGQWDEMATYASAIESEEGPELSTGSFLSAVLNVRHGNYQAAKSEPCCPHECLQRIMKARLHTPQHWSLSSK